MTRTRKIALTLSAALLASLLAPQAWSADPPATTMPAPTTKDAPAKRDSQAIVADLTANSTKLHELIPSLMSLTKPDFRKDNAARIAPLFTKIAALFNELADQQTGDQQKALHIKSIQYLSFAVVLADQNAAQQLADFAANKDPDIALSAQSALAMGNWIHNSDNPKAQQKVLEDFTAVAKAHPDSEILASNFMQMTQIGPANIQSAANAVAALKSTMKGPDLQPIFEQAQAFQTRIDLLNKPLTVTGRTTTNSKLSTDSLKGKVVMLDCWATWCGPCKAELPRIIELYKTYHDQGLEIVGIDCDASDEDPNTYTKQNNMPWPQLRETSQTGESYWHPLTKQFGVNSIPTMFLIDKSGTVRYVDAREDTEQKIKLLLAEPAPQSPAK